VNAAALLMEGTVHHQAQAGQPNRGPNNYLNVYIEAAVVELCEREKNEGSNVHSLSFPGSNTLF
jgi:hypothetical protein